MTAPDHLNFAIHVYDSLSLTAGVMDTEVLIYFVFALIRTFFHFCFFTSFGIF